MKDKKWIRKIKLKLGLRKFDIHDNWDDSNPNTIKLLDTILEFLYIHQDQTHGYGEIGESLSEKNISMPNIHRGLDYLIEDKYVTEIEPSKIQIQPIKFKINLAEDVSYSGIIENSSRGLSTFFISMKGINFYNSGGYLTDKKRFWKKEKNVDYFFKFLTAILTVVGIYQGIKNGQLKEKFFSLEKRNSTIEAQVLQLQKLTPVQQTYYILSDSTIQNVNQK